MTIRGRKGQTMVEYVLAACALVVVVSSLAFLFSATRQAVVRTERIVSSDYP